MLILFQQLIGIVLAVLIIALGNFFVERFDNKIWFHLSVALLLTATFFVTKLKTLNFLPAYFLGMIIWFGLNTSPSLNEIIKASLSLLIGFIFGWINENANTKVEKYGSN